MWKRRKRGREPTQGEPGDIFADLRTQVLELDPRAAGIEPSDDHPRVWGALMDMGMGEELATLVTLADGSTSLYTSTGGGVIGGGEHESVRRETHRFLSVLEQHLHLLAPEEEDERPADGVVRFRALTYDGRLAGGGPNETLGEGDDPLSPVFYAGHEVIGALRQISPR